MIRFEDDGSGDGARLSFDEGTGTGARIKVIGVGGGGGNAVNRMIASRIAGVEFLFDDEGRAWTYDININTNYNGQAEAAAGVAGTERAGMMAVARFLGEQAGQIGAFREAAE